MERGEEKNEKNKGITHKEEAYTRTVQHLVNEILKLDRYHYQVTLPLNSRSEWVTYYQQVEQMLEVAHDLALLLSTKEDANDRIGRYLVEAKKEAERIVLAAKKEAQSYIETVHLLYADTYSVADSTDQQLENDLENSESQEPSAQSIINDRQGHLKLRQVEHERLKAIKELQFF